MQRISLDPGRSVLIVVDVQPTFMKGIWEAERVLARTEFLARAAHLLHIPVLATLQNSKRMGGLDASLVTLIPSPIDKQSFSCMGCERFVTKLEELERTQVILVGIETHICVSLTSQDLLEKGYQVAVCPDGVSAGSVDRHKLGMERIRDSGAVPVHSEAVIYEWMGSAGHPNFREALALVKQFRA